MKKFVALILALILMAMPLVSLAASKTSNLKEKVTCYVNTGNTGRLNVRTSPSVEDNNLLTRLDNGTEVKITGYYDGCTWAIIEFKLNKKTVTGYVMNRYLSIDKPVVVTKVETVEQKINFKNFKHVEPYAAMVRPSTPGGFVNMRWAPSKANDVMTKLYADTQVIVIAQDKTWAQIYEPVTGYVGYMMRSFLREGTAPVTY